MTKFNTQCLESSEGNVWKYIFQWDDAVAEAVLYRYPDFRFRTVMCVSVQCGCPIGCTFCGTGRKFIRNLTTEEITAQVEAMLIDKHLWPSTIGRFQIMFMSMGEPLLNWPNVAGAIRELHTYYPDAELLISTMGPRCDDYEALLDLSFDIPKVGLQYSLHATTEQARGKLIPSRKRLPILKMRDFLIVWHQATGRLPYINYIVNEKAPYHEWERDIRRLRMLFPPPLFNITLSVLCSKDETMRDAATRNMRELEGRRTQLRHLGYNVHVFDPACQDDIGGGCGQLWHVQRFLSSSVRNSGQTFPPRRPPQAQCDNFIE